MIGASALAIWMDVEPSGEDDFNEWYLRQHVPERLSVPGFLRGRRYRVVGDGPAYFTLYETSDLSVHSSPAYLERLNNPTDWTRRSFANFRRFVRNACRLVGSSPSDSVQPFLVTARIAPAADGLSPVREALSAQIPGALLGIPGIRGYGVYEQDAGGSTVMTEERRIVGDKGTAGPPFVVVCESDGLDAGALATREFWRMWSTDTGADVTVNLYQFMYGLAWISAAPSAASSGPVAGIGTP